MQSADIWNEFDIQRKQGSLTIQIGSFLFLQIAPQINISGAWINISVSCDIN